MTLGAGLDALVPRQHLVQHVVEIGGGATLPQSMQAVARGGED